MAKDIDKAHIYDLGEVWIAESLDTKDPEPGEEFGEGWTEVGLLDGDEGFSTSREEDKNKHYAWGSILVRESRQKFTLARTFTALEDNSATRQLIWPGSTSKQIKQPKPKPIKIAFVKHDGDITVTEITTKHALVDMEGEVNENETDLTKYPLKADIYPAVTAAGNIYFDVTRYDEARKVEVDEDGEPVDGGGESGE